jgi:hypothetical protein
MIKKGLRKDCERIVKGLRKDCERDWERIRKKMGRQVGARDGGREGVYMMARACM